MNFCKNCSGAILPPGPMGWGGAICYCPRPLTEESQYHPWKELNLTEIEYWKKRRIEQSQELHNQEDKIERLEKERDVYKEALNMTERFIKNNCFCKKMEYATLVGEKCTFCGFNINITKALAKGREINS